MNARPRDADAPPSLALGALHLFVLSSLAVAQPLLDVLARAPEFFLAQRLGASDVLLAAVVACVLVPTLLMLIEALLGLISSRLRALAHVVFVTLLATLLASLVVQRVPLPGSAQLAAAVVLGIALGFAYARSAQVRSFVTVLAPAIVAVPALFLLASPIARILRPSDARPVLATAPQPYSVVMVVFDEFATVSLLDERHEIDRERYPNLAALAHEATWFRNATTVADVTQAAVAALLTGRYPVLDPLAVPEVHDANLFTALAGSHALDVRESYVPFCPLDLCPQPAAEARERRRTMLRDLGVVLLHVLTPAELRDALPDLSVPVLMLRPGGNVGALDARIVAAQQHHRGSDPAHRARLLDGFVAAVGAGPTPALHYLHVLLPHEPSMHLPSGRVCTPDAVREPLLWGEEVEPARRAQVRHLMQVELVDAFVGRLVRTLKESGRWDSTILILTGDHGVSYRPGNPRRAISRENLCDIVAVPLLVKLPGQASGGASDANAESIDVLPTILDALGVAAPWPMDGRPLSGDGAERATKKLIGPYWGALEKDVFPDGGPVTMASRLDPACLGVERKIELVGAGADRRKLHAPGAFAPLIGRRVAELPRAPARTDVRATLADAAAFAHVAPDAVAVPCTIRAEIAAAAETQGYVAVAIGGVVRAVTPIEPVRAGGARIVATVDEDSFVPGRNVVELFLVERDADGLALAPIADAGAGAAGVASPHG